MLNAILDSTLIVALAEMGDKTQLLSLMLVLRYKRPWPIMAGILVATILNHLMATWVGALVAEKIPELWLQYGLAALFVIFGLWILKPDSTEGLDKTHFSSAAFVASTIAFFMAEMGDKTQLVTVALAAQHKSVLYVTIGSTLGMLFANSLSVFGGERLIKMIPMNYIRYGACAVFIICGLIMLPVW